MIVFFIITPYSYKEEVFPSSSVGTYSLMDSLITWALQQSTDPFYEFGWVRK